MVSYHTRYRRTPKMIPNIYLAFRTIRTTCSAFLHYAYQFPTTYYVLWPFLCIVYLPQHFQSNWGATPHTHLHALHAVANVVQLGRYLIHAFACDPCCSKRNAIGGATPYTHWRALHAVANAVQLGRYPIHAFACAPCCSKRSAIGTLPHTRIGVRSILYHIGARPPLPTSG